MDGGRPPREGGTLRRDTTPIEKGSVFLRKGGQPVLRIKGKRNDGRPSFTTFRKRKGTGVREGRGGGIGGEKQGMKGIKPWGSPPPWGEKEGLVDPNFSKRYRRFHPRKMKEEEKLEIFEKRLLPFRKKNPSFTGERRDTPSSPDAGES